MDSKKIKFVIIIIALVILIAFIIVINKKDNNSESNNIIEKNSVVNVIDKTKLNLYLNNPSYIDRSEENIIPESLEEQDYQSDLGI